MFENYATWIVVVRLNYFWYQQLAWDQSIEPLLKLGRSILESYHCTAYWDAFYIEAVSFCLLNNIIVLYALNEGLRSSHMYSQVLLRTFSTHIQGLNIRGLEIKNLPTKLFSSREVGFCRLKRNLPQYGMTWCGLQSYFW